MQERPENKLYINKITTQQELVTQNNHHTHRNTYKMLKSHQRNEEASLKANVSCDLMSWSLTLNLTKDVKYLNNFNKIKTGLTCMLMSSGCADIQRLLR